MSAALDAVERFLAPTSLVQALAALCDGGGATVLAGGTDLMPQSRAGRLPPARTLINIRRVPGLDAVEVEGDILRLGTLTTIATLLAHPLVHQHAPLLVEAADHFASDQIRNAATVGGNICNASPSADTAPALLVLGARAVLTGAQAERNLPLEDFFIGPGKTALQPGELLIRLEIPRSQARSGSCYLRHTPRAWMDLAFVGVAVGLQLGEQGEILSSRIALGAVAPVPMRAYRTEERLTGCQPDETILDEASRLASSEIRPIDDLRASAEYRRHLAEVLTRRALEQAIASARAKSLLVVNE